MRAKGVAVPCRLWSGPLVPPMPIILHPYPGLLCCRMERAYVAALDKLGGLEKAKPKAMLELLQRQFPRLTIQASWRALAQRCAGRCQRRHAWPGVARDEASQPVAVLSGCMGGPEQFACAARQPRSILLA